jgi:hypothetical protein
VQRQDKKLCREHDPETFGREVAKYIQAHEPNAEKELPEPKIDDPPNSEQPIICDDNDMDDIEAGCRGRHKG